MARMPTNVKSNLKPKQNKNKKTHKSNANLKKIKDVDEKHALQKSIRFVRRQTSLSFT